MLHDIAQVADVADDGRPVADLDVANGPTAGPDSFEEVGHVLIIRPARPTRVVEAEGVGRQRLVEEFLVAGLDPAPVDAVTRLTTTLPEYPEDGFEVSRRLSSFDR